jgi:hypothetical protein
LYEKFLNFQAIHEIAHLQPERCYFQETLRTILMVEVVEPELVVPSFAGSCLRLYFEEKMER